MNKKKLDVIFAAPHPDDLEIGCGGAIALMAKNGYRVGMIHLTNGEPTPNGSPEIRIKEAHAAAEVLGVEVCEILPLTNRELMDCPKSRYALATVLRRYCPKILVGLAGKTPQASPDHYQSQLITEAARFYSQLTKWDDRFDNTPPHRIDHLIYRPIPNTAETLNYPTQFVVDISTTIEKKLAALKCYESQFTGQRFDRLRHYIESVAGAEGGRAGYRYGELYALPRPIGTKDMVNLLGSWEIPPPFQQESNNLR
ncbi:MAG: PIG-L family deacetylase [Planctomycetota bacterium]|nr:MAG: PIG-L family deacetylase [Planctomycetota bacterium]